MFKRYLFIILIAIMLLTAAACSASDSNTVSELDTMAETTSGWRCSLISYDDSLVTQYKYDSDGKLVEIIEYQNQGLDSGDEQWVSCTRIAFDNKGNISAVTTNANGMSTEIVDSKTWRLYSDSYSLSVSYNDLYLCETQVVDLVNDMKITTKTKFDADGKATSATTEFDYYGEMPVYKSDIVYEYEYDRNGNPIIQYSLTEDGKQITATYSWER